MEHKMLRRYQDKFRRELLESCVPFWLKNSVDTRHGGIYNSLTREGKVFATDKSVWLQGRCAWSFARLCHQYGIREEWREISQNCLDFLQRHAVDCVDKRMYFTLTDDGKPLRKRRYYFSETFYILALAEYARAFHAPQAMTKAREYYALVMDIYRDPASDPFKITPKVLLETRQTRSFANTMILLNVSHLMAECDGENRQDYLRDAEMLARDFLRYFIKEDLQAVLEMTGASGEFLQSATGGRTMNPGHAIEGAWFLAKHGEKTANAMWIEKACDIFRWSVERGWDAEHGGLLAFVDVLGYPPEALEHNMKLWWPMCELLICSILLYKLTMDEYFLNWFRRADQYCDQFFRDEEYGEWYGYLAYDNTPVMDRLKGSLFKGPFHVPRALILVDQCLEELLQGNQ